MDKILSIIIPSCNMERYLRRACGSLVLNDTDLLSKIDVIIVNDGSKDRTGEIAHEFASKYPGVFRVVDKQNGHYGSCINAGVDVASGVFVKVLDADDYFGGDTFRLYLGKLIELESRHPGHVDAVITDFDWVYDSGEAFQHTAYDLPAWKPVRFEDGDVKFDAPVLMHALTYRTENLHKISYRQTEGVCFTDNEWIFEPFSTVKQLCYMPLTLYKYVNGRAGQSTDSRLRFEQVWMSDRVLESLSRRYARIAPDISPKMRRCLYLVAEAMATYVYQTEILCLHDEESDRRLVSVDVALATWPALYRRVDEMKFSRKVPVRYVRLWRKNRSCRSVIMRMFLLVAGVVMKCASMRSSP